MMLPALICCHFLGALHADENAKLDERQLKRALNWDKLTDESRHEIRAAGGYSEAAYPLYLQWLDDDPPQHWATISRVLFFLQLSKRDRSEFRKPVVKLVGHDHPSVTREAVHLLELIGTEEDAAAVAAQLKRPFNDVAYFYSIVKTLSAIGTEKEIETLEAYHKAGFLEDHPEFWHKVLVCEKAIRERAAKKKDPKAKSVDKK